MLHWLFLYAVSLGCLVFGVSGFLILFGGMIILFNEPNKGDALMLIFVGFVFLAGVCATLQVLS